MRKPRNAHNGLQLPAAARVACVALAAALAVLPAVALTAVNATAASAQTSPSYDENGPQGTIYRLYRAYFLREPDAAGFQYWSNAHAAGYPLTAVSDDFARSAEFQARYGNVDDRAFLDLVYRNVLDRAPDQAGYNHWLALMQQGMQRGAVMVHFSDSAEFRAITAGNVPPGYQQATFTDLSGYLPPPPPGGTVQSDNIRDGAAARLIEFPGGCQELMQFFLSHVASVGLTVSNLSNPETNPAVTADAWSFQTYATGIHGFVICTADRPGEPAFIDFSVVVQS